ncbi:prorelaxin-like [Trichechus inunguis]|uniref:Prorelaxin-like n=1 Tax=Trichechus manatus latirostris TaxID=127582 RepID=A0A2Y9FVR3_TRIMA|nr:prorelaxin-like [Trichechus manatus latirostris]
MPHPLLHLLGVWLLLNQLPRELSAHGSNIVKLCGRELARARIEICGQINWGKGPDEDTPPVVSDTVSSSINEDTKTLNMISEFTPNFQKKVAANEGLVKIIQKRQSQTEDNSRPELKNLGLDRHSIKKRTEGIQLSNKCCFQGCTIKELARGC